MPRMWPFRRRQRLSALDLAPLERLAELVERVVLLLEERRADSGAPEEPEPDRPLRAVPPTPVPEQRPPEPQPPEPRPLHPAEPAAAEAHLLFVGGPHGYRLVERDGRAPGRGEAVEVEGLPERVLRLGPSPLPGDRRRCAFVEPEQPRTAPAV